MSASYPKLFTHEHDPDSVRRRIQMGARESYLRDIIYGAIDGTVTTFAVISGVVGANLQIEAIVILGAANLFADGFSMAAGNYLSTKTEIDQRALIEQFESNAIDEDPCGEETEVREILKAKGYDGDLLNRNTQFITADKTRWLNTMLTDEFGLASAVRSPMKSALLTFVAFATFGSIPLLTYIFNFKSPFAGASILTAVSFALIGSLKSKWTIETPVLAATKTFLLGTLASVIAYGVGWLLRFVV